MEVWEASGGIWEASGRHLDASGGTGGIRETRAEHLGDIWRHPGGLRTPKRDPSPARIPGYCPGEGNPGDLGATLHQPDGYRIQDTPYNIQDTGYNMQHTGYRHPGYRIQHAAYKI